MRFRISQLQLKPPPPRAIKLHHCLFPTGTSVLVIPPDAVFPGELGDAGGLLRRDRALGQLRQDILRFIYAYAPQADACATEE